MLLVDAAEAVLGLRALAPPLPQELGGFDAPTPAGAAGAGSGDAAAGSVALLRRCWASAVTLGAADDRLAKT